MKIQEKINDIVIYFNASVLIKYGIGVILIIYIAYMLKLSSTMNIYISIILIAWIIINMTKIYFILLRLFSVSPALFLNEESLTFFDGYSGNSINIAWSNISKIDIGHMTNHGSVGITPISTEPLLDSLNLLGSIYMKLRFFCSETMTFFGLQSGPVRIWSIDTGMDTKKLYNLIVQYKMNIDSYRNFEQDSAVWPPPPTVIASFMDKYRK